jgi:hypothetical protein
MMHPRRNPAQKNIFGYGRAVTNNMRRFIIGHALRTALKNAYAK